MNLGRADGVGVGVLHTSFGSVAFAGGQQEAVKGLSWTVTSHPGSLTEMLLALSHDTFEKETLGGVGRGGRAHKTVWPLARTKTCTELVTVGIERRVCTTEAGSPPHPGGSWPFGRAEGPVLRQTDLDPEDQTCLQSKGAL